MHLFELTIQSSNTLLLSFPFPFLHTNRRIFAKLLTAQLFSFNDIVIILKFLSRERKLEFGGQPVVEWSQIHTDNKPSRYASGGVCDFTW